MTGRTYLLVGENATAIVRYGRVIAACYGRRMRQDTLEIFTIYDRPTDYPTGFVVRRSEIRPEGIVPKEAHTAPDLASARALVPRGLLRMPRCPDDDPVICELWL